MIETPVLDRVQALVVGIAGPDRTPPDAGPDTALIDGGFWLDSVSLLEVIIACEAEFGVALDSQADLTPDTLTTSRKLAALIERRC
jgi:acyl carrier protein